jgi:SAM-dependent MidA family methyltransferase
MLRRGVSVRLQLNWLLLQVSQRTQHVCWTKKIAPVSSESELATRPQSQLAELLAQRIRQTGRVTFHDWMAEALYHPEFGYYNRADLVRWGREGDYRTSPERSELFAATFVRYIVSLYEQLGHPAEFNMVEMGAGNGEFAAGVLLKLKRSFPKVFDVTRYLIIEESKVSRQLAKERLDQFRDRVEFAEHENVQPLQSGILFTNELLDAFPVHRLTLRGGELKELFVSVDNEGKFVWVVDNPSSQHLIEACRNHLPALAEGQILELNLRIRDWFRKVAAILATGYVITVDYGDIATELYAEHRPNGTIRAFRKHEFIDDVLSDPGECDITSSVNWTFVESEGKKYGFDVIQFSRLDRFLMQVGILEELESRLTEARSEAEKSALTTSAREMILPGGMASSFQVLIQKR